MDKIKYSIGLDIGTGSVGWSVSDANGKLLRKKGKNLWGVRLFDGAQTAEQRRISRSQRRRYNRRKFRIMHLQALLGDMVFEKDPNFFVKLRDSFLWQEDRSEKNKYNIFNDENYTDEKYYKEFKTIYHLRYALATNKNKKFDPRLIYLALHHIVKNRGHFLFEDSNINLSSVGAEDNFSDTIKECLSDNIIKLNEIYGLNLPFDSLTLQKVISIIQKDKLRNSEKAEAICDVFKASKTTGKVLKENFKLALGMSGNLKTLFSIKGDTELKNINLSNAEQEDIENVLMLIEGASEEFSGLFNAIIKLYNATFIGNILKESKFISYSMISNYNKHNQDLYGNKEGFIGLKKFIKKYYANEYDNIFRNKTEKYSYALYIDSENKLRYEDFSKNLKELLKTNKSEDSVFIKNLNYILNELDNGLFLTKQRVKTNSAIPYQVHKIEFEEIIENQSKFYPVLKDIKDKLVDTLMYKVDYFVGPLANDGDKENSKTPFSWVVRSNEKITPWNYNEVINKDESAEEFISRMTNNCTYLFDEKVLPANSIVFSKFKLLNELNGITDSETGNKINTDLKKSMVENLFKTTKKVTTKRLLDYWNDSSIENVSGIRGTQKENAFASSLSSYIDFSKIFRSEIEKEKDFIEINLDMIEEIIYYITVLPDNKAMLRSKISSKFPSLTKEHLNRITNLKYSGWGSLSEKLINGFLTTANNLTKQTVLDVLEDTNMVFNQIITNERFSFKTQIEEHNRSQVGGGEITYENVAELSGSPALKRGIWQAVKIVEELKDVIGYEPTNIYLEMARGSENKRKGKRTDSRKKQLLNLYQKLTSSDDLKNLSDEIGKRDDKEFNNEKLFLYYLQNGQCMYTGKPLNPDNLSIYEVDHIIPQNIRTDNSINNKALVLLEANQAKKGGVNLPEVVKKRSWFWELLLKNGLISQTKLRNLSLTTLTDKQLYGFIARQLVETRQILKHLSTLLSQTYKKTRVLSISSGLVSSFRKQFGYLKNEGAREINDYHHAQDAYIITIVGNYAQIKFPEIISGFDENRPVYKYRNLKSKSGFIVGSMLKDKENQTTIVNKNDGEVLWGADEVFRNVERTYYFSDCLITKKLFREKGKLYKETRYSSLKNQALDKSLETKKNLIPLKGKNNPISDVYKYGGYSAQNISYSVLVEYLDSKNKIKSRIVDIPVLVSIKDSKNEVIDEIKRELGEGAKILKTTDINKNQLIVCDNKDKFYFKSSSERNNAKQLVFGKKNKWAYDYIYNIFDSWRDYSYKNKDNNINLLEKREEFSKRFLLLYSDIIEKEFKVYSQISPILRDYVKSDLYLSFDIQTKENLVKDLLKATQAGAQRQNLNKYFKHNTAGGKVDEAHEKNKNESGNTENKSLKNDFTFAGSGSFGRITSRLDMSRAKIVNTSITGIFEN